MLVTVGLVASCGDELGHAPYKWDAGLLARPPSDASDSRASDAQRDASADADASETAIRDAADISIEASRDVGADAAGDADAAVRADVSLDGDASLDGDSSVDSDASLDGDAGDASYSEGGREGGPTGTPLHAVLRARSLSCLSCAESSCPTEFVGCETISGAPDAGGDAGATRSQLCAETLNCLLATRCEENDRSFCYCGDALRADDGCLMPAASNGKCKSEIERSFESTDPNRVMNGIALTDRETGGGWAFALMQCIRDNDCDGCFPRPVDGGSDVKADR